MKKCFILIAFLCLCGCGAAFNPYQEDFACPDYEKGKCIKVEGAYKESLQNKKNNALTAKENQAACARCRKEAQNNSVSETASCTACFASQSSGWAIHGLIPPADAGYQKAVNQKLATMLKEPNTPLVAPPQVIRILVLPYQGDQNELYMMRYIYLLVEDAQWVLGRYLINSEE